MSERNPHCIHPPPPIKIAEWQWLLINADAGYRAEKFHMYREREGELVTAIERARKARAKRIAEGRPRVD